MPVDERQRGLREERGDGIAAGIDADDRRAAEEVALTGAEAVEPHSEQALERGRDVLGGDLADRRKQLLGEQGVPARRVDDALQRFGRDGAGAVADQVLDLAGR